MSVVVVGDFARTSIALIASMALARMLPTEEMGTYRQLQYLSVFAASLVELGLSGTVYRFWNSLDEQRREIYLRMVLSGSMISASIAAGALWVATPIVATSFNNPDLRILLPIAALLPLSSVPILLLRPILISEGKALQATTFEIVMSLFPMAALLASVSMGHHLRTSIAVWALTSTLRLIILPLVFWHRLSKAESGFWDKIVFKEVWGYLWPIQVSRLPGLLMGHLDKIIMSVFLSPSAFAVYALGARRLPFLSQIGPSVSQVLIPNLTIEWQEGRVENICRRWRKASLRTALLTYPISVFSIMHAVPIMTFFFSSTYEESSVPFRFFAGVPLIAVIEYASLAKVMNRTKLIVRSAFGSLIYFLAAATLFTHLFGVPGMAFSVVSTRLAGSSIFLIAYRRALQRPLTDFFPFWRLIWVLGLASLANGLAALVLAPLVSLQVDGILSLSWRLGVHLATGVGFFLLPLVLHQRLRQILKGEE